MSAKKVLIFAPYGAWMVHHQLDAVIGAALAHRGCEVLVVGCDGVLDSCFIAGKPPSAENCRACAATGAAYFGRMGLKTAQLRQMITPEDRAEAAAFAKAADLQRIPEIRYGTYPLGKWCPPSMQSYFSTADFRLDLDWVVKAIRDQVADGVMLVRALGRLMDQFRPDQVFSYNSTHFFYRIANELGKERGLPVLVHERGHLNDSFTLLDGESTNANQGRFDAFKAWEDVPLTAGECREVETYFREREEGKNGFSRFYAFDSRAENVRSLLRIPPDAPILALFGSGDRELGAFETVQRKTFAGQIEWIRRTAEICRKRGWYLVIRHHPSNVIRNQVNFPFISALAGINRDMPDCVRVVMPHEKLTSYAILWNADGAVTHFSTMGSETPTRGVVGVCVGDSLYQPLGVEWAGEPDRYESALVSSMEKTRDFGLAHLRRAYRGAHYVVFKLGYKFKSFGIKDVYAPEIKFADRSELGPGNDPILDRVCDYVMRGTPLLPVPGAEDRARDESGERAFLERELAEIKARRQAIKASTSKDNTAAGPLLSVFCVGGPDASGIRDKSLARSREQRIERIELDADPAGDTPGFFEALGRALAQARGACIYLAFPGFDVDESVFANSVDFLAQPGNRDFSSVAWGAWLSDPGGKLHEELFTEARPADTYESAVKACPALAHPARMFGFLVFRKEYLVELLGWLEAMSGFGERELAAVLFGLIKGKPEDAMKRMTIPMIAVYPAAEGGPAHARTAAAATPGLARSAPIPDPIAAPAAVRPDLSPDEMRAKLEEYAQDLSRNPGDLEAALRCGNMLENLGECLGARRIYTAMKQRHPDDPRFKTLFENVEWNSRKGLAAVHEWALRGRGYRELQEKHSLSTFEEAKPYVESVPGWMLDGQEKFLFDKVKSLPDGAVILEMGADRGRSTCAMALACKGSRKRIFSIDTFAGNDGIMGKTYDFYHEWHGNLARLGLDGYVTGLQGYTFDVLPKWSTPVDFAFIDASHEYIDVLNDYALTYPHVKEGGWIAFHDVEPSWPGPWRVWLDYGLTMLTHPVTVANLACGRKSRTMPLRREFKEGIAFSFAREWSRDLARTPDPNARALAAALQVQLEADLADRAARDRARDAERAIQSMPDYLKTTFRNMITKDAHLDGWLHYWHGLLYEAEGKAEEAAREFAEALMVSYPAPAALVSLHRLSDRQAPAGMAAWSGRRLAGAEVVLEWGSGAGLLLRQLPGRAKIGIEGDVRLRKQASLEAGIDAVELAEELPDGAADAWVSDLALERAPAPLAVLQSMARKLKAGGKALVSVSLHRAGETPDGKTLYAWTPETLRNLFQAAGYAVKEVSLAAADATAAGTGDARRILLEAVKASAEAPAGPGRGTGDWAMVPSGNAAPAAAAKGTDPKDIPVALVAYNRPEHTRQVLKALADHGIRNLHVFLDGPKGNGDEQAVRETRRVVEGFPGIRPEIHAEERNRGLAKSIMAAANTLFADHEHMALLEDDCVPQKHCFDFMARALDRYRDDSHVFGISGYSVPMTPEILSQYPYDAYFCPRIGSWGWATWKRAWNLMETDIVAACRKALDARIDLSQGGNDIPHSLEGLLQGHVKDVWTLHWVLTVYLNRGQFLYPTVSHIDNIGMDGTGVHCGRTDKYDTTLAQHPSTRFPESIAPDPRTLARFRSFYDLPALQAAGRA